MTSSSIAIASQPGVYYSNLGYKVSAGKTQWKQFPAPSNNDYIETIYRSGDDNHVQAALTVRRDQMNEVVDISEYAKKWIKDYQRFGFQILASNKVRAEKEIGFMFDLVHRDSGKQLRQVLFAKNKNVVTLTCRDDISSFRETLRKCNDIIRTFEWLP